MTTQPNSVASNEQPSSGSSNFTSTSTLTGSGTDEIDEIGLAVDVVGRNAKWNRIGRGRVRTRATTSSNSDMLWSFRPTTKLPTSTFAASASPPGVTRDTSAYPPFVLVRLKPRGDPGEPSSRSYFCQMTAVYRYHQAHSSHGDDPSKPHSMTRTDESIVQALECSLRLSMGTDEWQVVHLTQTTSVIGTWSVESGDASGV